MHRRVRSLDGIQTIVQFGDNVAILDPTIIAMLRQRTGDEEVVTLNRQVEVGASVLITDGPFRGLEAVVTQLLPAKERVRVLLEWLNRMVEIEAPLPKVLPKTRPTI
jgi:transcription antitermination factor NusG